jgi:spore maturation protein CgeB
MLAERSEVHTQLFKENEEAVFFSSKEELFEKVKRYMADPAERNRIAINGYNRCFASGYTHVERMKTVLKMVIED